MLLIAAVFSGVAAVRFLVLGHRANALKAAAGAAGCIVFAFVLVKTMHPSPETLGLVPAARSDTAAPAATTTL
ncbi:MAG TPA: hypothetical protein VFT93_01140, partial [Candidatus Eisenbacteria bacterium]|nr:hypothetical protein [Candidatus Eisenbacteria bacterium]